ncbi:MAG TPA: amidohydrolase family protein, partial [Thermoanaerobaculia bacterium]|nr:amidohydrolase family protein [Thermoanaerobaculia bacterium]
EPPAAVAGAVRRAPVRPAPNLLVAGVAGLALLSACSDSAAGPPAGAAVTEASTGRLEAVVDAPVPLDVHVHLIGPQLLADWKSLGVPFSKPDVVYLSAASWLGPAEPGFAGQPPAARRAILVPMAHLYGRSEFREAVDLTLEEERARVATENDHVAAEAARFPGRAVALCSVAALRPFAEAEIERCRRELGTAGLKLHLAASEVDLADAGQLAAIERIVAGVAGRGELLLLHLDPQRRGLETADVERFLRQVLGPHPDLTVIVAHLGGSGGYGAWTRGVFRTVLDWLAERRAAGEARPGVRFDVSAVVLERESEGVPATTAEEAAQLAADLRRAGFERLLLGSDAPVFDPRRTVELLRDRVGLTQEEIDRLLANEVPGLFDDGVERLAADQGGD